MLNGTDNFIEEFRIPGRAEIDPDRFAQVTGVQVSELIELSGKDKGKDREPLADVSLIANGKIDAVVRYLSVLSSGASG
jgi:hypothetical protein